MSMAFTTEGTEDHRGQKEKPYRPVGFEWFKSVLP